MIKVRAPGKLFLLGEYVVLYGGPAVLISANRYLNVSIQASSSSFKLHSKGAQLPDLEGVWHGEQLSWANATEHHELALCVIDALVQDGICHRALPPFELCIDSSELFINGTKLGLGSSAALTHALARAITDYANECEASATERHSIDAQWVFNVHRNFQQGRGSGADIAAGVVGGAFTFQRLSDHCVPQIEPITLPTDLCCSFSWVGRAASTTNALKTLENYHRAHPARFTQHLTPLMHLAEFGSEALKQGDVAQFSNICQQYCHNLSEFGAKVGIDVVSPEHLRLTRIASEVGVAYKPSGAGGGDFGVAFSNEISKLEEFQRRVIDAGNQIIRLDLGQPCHRY